MLQIISPIQICYNKFQNINNPNKFQLRNDVFEKSVSFGKKSNNDNSNIEKYVNELKKEYSASIKSNNLEECSDNEIINHIFKQQKFRKVLFAISKDRDNFTKSYNLRKDQQMLNPKQLQILNMPIQEYLKFVNIKETNIKQEMNKIYHSQFDQSFLEKTLLNAGITRVLDIYNFIGRFFELNTFKIFNFQEMEALKIYARLKDKNDICNFPDILLYFFNKYENDNYKFNVNAPIDFLKSFNITTTKNFEKEFSYLKSNFNGFSKVSDKADAIEYLKATYNDKINLLENKFPNYNVRELYALNHDVIDTLYMNNKGENLVPIEKFAYLLPQLACLRKNNADFTSPQDKIFILEFLSEYGLNIDDLAYIKNKKDIISDNDIFDCLSNKNYIINNANEEYFNKFYDCYNVIYNNGNYYADDFNTFENIINTYKINDKTDFLKLYGVIKSNGQKSPKKIKNITSEEFKSFIDLMSFNDFSKKQTPKISDLELSKQNFINIENEIKNFIENDSDNYFLGQSPLHIYLKYKKSFDENPNNIKELLNNIKTFNIQNINQYDKKIEKINSLKECFNGDNKSFTDFVIKNNIKFDFTPKDDKFIKNCNYVLSLTKDNDKIFEYYKNSDFLSKSKEQLNNFYSLYNENELKEVLNIIAEKEVPSVKSLKKHADNNDEYNNIIENLKNLPDDINFNNFDEIISKSNKQLEKLNLNSIKIDNRNIKNIDLTLTKNWGNNNIISILNNIMQPDENNNFITKLPEFINDNKKYTRFDIANEIAEITKDDIVNKKKNLSYKNILTKFNINEKHDNTAIYTKMIDKKIPDEFINFVNDKSYLELSNGEKANLSLHAKLRLIERFGFNAGADLFSNETKTYLNNIIKEVYGTKSLKQIQIQGTKDNSRILTECDNNIKTAFSVYGKMITIMN